MQGFRRMSTYFLSESGRRGRGMAWLAACCCLVLGCGGKPQGSAVSGKVTFQGKAVPAGRIYFNPDFTKGNDGPQGFAEIRAGAFDTRDGGKPACGGPTIVVIRGLDAPAETAPGSGRTPLFREYQESLDLPRESCTRDFEVPLSAADDLPAPRRVGRGP
jgi:hypothetical protein